MHLATPLRLLGFALLLTLSGCATTGGRSGPPRSPESRLHPGVIQGRLRAPSRAPAGSLAEFVIYVDAAKRPAGAAAKDARGAKRALVGSPRERIGLGARGFSPRVVAVAPGDSVDFVNRDRRFHSAFSVSEARHFDLGSIPPNGVRSMRFDKAGAVRVFCTLHSESSGYVIVAPSRVFARADASGSFALPELTPGSYRVRVWHPRFGERSWPVELARRGLAIDLRF